MEAPTTNTSETEKKPSQASALEVSIEAIVEFAVESPTISSFYRKCLPVFSSCLRATYLEVEQRHAGTIVHETYSDGKTPSDFWEDMAQEVLTDALMETESRYRVFSGRNIELSVALFTAAIGTSGRRGGAIAAVIPFRNHEELEQRLEDLDLLCALASSLVDTLDNAAPSAASSGEEVSRIRKVAEFTSEVELAYAITNKLRTKDGAVQVALGGVQEGQVKILSVSGLDDIAPRSPGIKNIRFAMQECADMGEVLTCQESGLEGINNGARLHRKWKEDTGDANVVSIPLFDDSELVAVLSIQRQLKAAFDKEELEEFRTQVEPYAAGLEMVRIARRSLFSHFKSTVSQAFKTIMLPGAWGRKTVLAGSLVALLWALYGSMSYSITAPCALSPSSGRHVAAAFDGVLRQSKHQPGDYVEAGDVLCEFDTTELDLEAARLRGELAMFDVDIYRSLGESNAADAGYAKVNSKAVEANLNLVLHKIQQATVKAPVSGVLVAGDHRDRIGDSFAKGETLFRIASSGNWRIQISVSEKDIDEIKVGAIGTFASHSRPGEAHEFEISQISPMAETHLGQNVFTVEALCIVPGDWIRSGMEGFASIDASERSPAWVASHRLIDFFRLHLWL